MERKTRTKRSGKEKQPGQERSFEGMIEKHVNDSRMRQIQRYGRLETHVILQQG